MERNYVDMENFEIIMENQGGLIERSSMRMENLRIGLGQYPYSLNPLTTINDILQNFESVSELDRLRVTGCVDEYVVEDNTAYLTLRDDSGEIQVIVSRSYVGEQMYNRLLLVGMDDILRIDGARYLTEDGERAMKADRIQVLSRASRLLP